MFRKPSMFLRSPISVTYFAQIYMALVGIIFLPVYVRFLGLEGYGVVGIYVTLLTWLALLDVGMSASLARTAARFRADVEDASGLLGLLRLIRRIFLAIATLLAVAMTFGSDTLSERWLDPATLSVAQLASSLQLMGFALGLRFLAIPERSFLGGYEDFHWLAWFNIIISTLRSALVVVVLMISENELFAFFAWQAAVSLVEWLVLRFRVSRLAPAGEPAGTAGSAFARHWRFSVGISAMAAIWLAVSNVDKLILSALLPLEQFSVFMIATVAANAIQMLVAPFAIVFGPRLTRIVAGEDRRTLVVDYDKYSQAVIIFACASAAFLALFSHRILLTWTGDPQIANQGAEVLSLYALGNAFIAIGALPLQLQIARGILKWHVTGTLLLTILYLPALVLMANRSGATGAATAWLLASSAFALLWLPFIHRKFYPSSHWHWLLRCVSGPVLVALLIGYALSSLIVWDGNRWIDLMLLGALFGLLLVAVTLASPEGRATAKTQFRRLEI